MEIPKQGYTLEFKELAIKRVKNGQALAGVAKELGLVEQTLRNWVKAAATGKLSGAGGKAVTPEEMELSRLRADNIAAQARAGNHKKGGGVPREECAVKYAGIDAQGKAFALSGMCEALEVRLSGYRAWKCGGTEDRRRLSDSQMLALIGAIHAELKGAHGSPRMVRQWRARGFPANKKRVERLMRDHGIRARQKWPYKVTTDSKHGLPVAEILLDRNFTPSAPNQAWASDITHLWTNEGWLYLAIVLDLFNREVVGWSLKPRMTADIAPDALTMAWFRKRPAPGLLHHSDRGSQVCQPRLPGQAPGIRHDLPDGPEGQLLGQRPDGKLVQQLQERAGAWRPVRHPCRHQGRPFRVHRGVLQPEAAAFDPRLPVGDPVPGTLGQPAASGRTDSMKPTLGKTKNRGKLKIKKCWVADDAPGGQR
jgi:transposase-like protein